MFFKWSGKEPLFPFLISSVAFSKARYALFDFGERASSIVIAASGKRASGKPNSLAASQAAFTLGASVGFARPTSSTSLGKVGLVPVPSY